MNKKDRKTKGFSLAEMMIIVAIILILAGLGFIAVTRYLRVFKHFEYDNVAKEIFISAQNHLSMAHNEGYLTRDDYGTFEGDKVTASKDKDIYYFVVSSANNSEVDKTDSILNLMLPYGSIDETVRKNGSFIIRYDKKSARVLDVFYSEKEGTRFGHTFDDLYSEHDKAGNDLMDIRDDDHKSNRRNYVLESNGRDSIVGFYGGDNVDLVYGEELETPFLQVINAETLKAIVRVTKPVPANATVKLFVESTLDPSIKKYYELTDPVNNEYSFVLDDITKNGGHFADLFSEFKPGENIRIYAEISNNSELTNIAKSITITTNSIFGDDSTDTKADISNIRHLENLDKDVSDLAVSTITAAEQSADLDWKEFLNKVGNANAQVYKPGNVNTAMTSAGKYYPVKMADHVETYDGKNHQVSKVDASAAGDVGMFSIAGNKTIKNLELLDFVINATGDSGYGGALAGRLSASTVENVAVHDSVLGTGSSIRASVGGGGLAGVANNTSRISNSLAAVTVSGGSFAGGLVGNANNAQISGSYASGHTSDGKYIENKIDVTSSGYAGGLVGYARGTAIDHSYSTCSVDGPTAGGLAGSYGGATLSDSYAVGYVKVEKSGNDYNTNNKGGLIGENSGGTYSGCQYLKIANNSVLTGISGADDYSGVKAMDERDTSNPAKDNYMYFVSEYIRNNTASGVDALPYDSFLKDKYNGKYLYRGIRELTGTPLADNLYVSKHYGDWPCYETFVVNIAD